MKFRAGRYERNKTIQNKNVQQVEKCIYFFGEGVGVGVERSDLPIYST